MCAEKDGIVQVLQLSVAFNREEGDVLLCVRFTTIDSNNSSS